MIDSDRVTELNAIVDTVPSLMDNDSDSEVDGVFVVVSDAVIDSVSEVDDDLDN